MGGAKFWLCIRWCYALGGPGWYVEAEGIDQKVLDLRRELLGEKHPDTIRSMAELATTYHAQGRYDEALQLHQTALDLRHHVLGENHPDTMQSVAYLASIHEALQQLPSLV
jgi:cytochrome c-type biogenesis protein CcmH/NrfG